MDSGIDLNPPPPGSSSPRKAFFLLGREVALALFWAINGHPGSKPLGASSLKGELCLLAREKSSVCFFSLLNLKSRLGQPLTNCSYGAISKRPAWLEM